MNSLVMATATEINPQRLIISAILGIALLLVLIIKGKLQPIIAILISAIFIGIFAGMPYQTIVESVKFRNWRNT